MKAFCPECDTRMQVGFRALVTPSDYECDEDGDIIDISERLNPAWVDSIDFYGFWCPDCAEWYNEGIFREAPTEEEEEESSWERLSQMVDEDGEFNV